MSTPALSLLSKRRFAPLFITQFLGAFNDNLYRSAMLFLISFTLYRGEADRAALVAVIAGGVFILPRRPHHRDRRADEGFRRPRHGRRQGPMRRSFR